MIPLLTCLDEPELLPVATGEPAGDAIEQHLERCPDCRQRVERLRAELAALRLNFEGGMTPLSTEPVPALSPDGKPSSGGKTLNWASAPVETAAPASLGLEPVAAARAEGLGAIGKYLVVEPLDSGSQGQVYRVIHPGLGKDMVLKLGRRPVGGDERTSLVKEGRLLRDLEHINLVKIYDLDFHNEQPFLVMEYIHGRNLERYKRDEPVTPRRAAELVAKLAGALALVHRRDIIHRDIKPRNILIDESGEPRLIDFGLARLRHAWSDRPDATWGGTLAFMAPEQARLEHDRTGPRSDVFGLGAVLYFLLTGKPPFVGATKDEVWDRARRCEFNAGALRLAKVPRRLQRICLKAMAADPADRYATAEEFERALKWFIEAPRRMGIAAGLLLALALSLAIYQRPTSSTRPLQDPGSNVVPASASPNRISNSSPDRPAPLHGGITLRVEKQKPGDPHERGLRLNEPGAVPLVSGNGVRVEAWVDRPAYLYIFWLGSDGKAAPIYPWKDQDWTKRPEHEEKIKTLDLPEVVVETWPLPPSAPGLETLVLLAREDSPLPREADATLGRELAGPRTTRLPDGMTKAVWLDNGHEFGLDDQSKERDAPSPKTSKSDDPVLRIRRLLQEKLKDLGDYHRAVIVPNQGGR